MSVGAALGGFAVEAVGARWTFALSGVAALTGLVAIPRRAPRRLNAAG